MKYTQQETDSYILKNKSCNSSCNGCFYENGNYSSCKLRDEVKIYKNCKNGCENCDWDSVGIPCNYLYIKEQYDKLDLMRKILS